MSRIITRCTQDVASIDGQFAQIFDWFIGLWVRTFLAPLVVYGHLLVDSRVY
jgi:hypothetical protein